jgi:hypothetical protein
MSPTAPGGTRNPTLAPTPTPPTATGAVKGTVFEDTNNNGKQDPGEQGILNVDVVITDKNGDTQTVTTNSNGEYKTIVPAGSIVIDIDETTLPPGFVQTVGTNPTTVTVPAGGVATDLDGVRFPLECRGMSMGTDKRIKVTKFRNKSSKNLKGYATIDGGRWRSKVFIRNRNETDARVIGPICRGLMHNDPKCPKGRREIGPIPRGKQNIKVGLVVLGNGIPRVIYENTLKPKDWHLTDCLEYSVRIFMTTKTNKMTSCFNADFAPSKKCNSSVVPKEPFLEWKLTVVPI